VSVSEEELAAGALVPVSVEPPASGPAEPAEATATPVTLRFLVPLFATQLGQRLAVVGSLPALGGWQPREGVLLDWAEGHRWRGEVTLEVGGPAAAADGGGEEGVALPDGSQVQFKVRRLCSAALASL
jgi:hypothetical protein